MSMLKLYSGVQVSSLALGTFKAEPGLVKDAVKSAINCGYRTIDCAHVYGNEKEIGEALKESFQSGVPREDIFVISKIWSTYHSEKEVYKNINDILSDLQIEYLDCCLIHWPMGFKEGTNKMFPRDDKEKVLYSDIDYLETYKAMEKLSKEGKIRHPGLSNFNEEQMRRVLDNCSIKPAIHQFECHAYLNQKRLVKFCIDNNVLPMAYAPLGSPNRPWKTSEEPILLEEGVITDIAKKHNILPSQVLIRFLLQRGILVGTKSTNEGRIKDNLKSLEVSIDDEDMEKIYAINKNYRFFSVQWYNDHKYYPFKDEIPSQ